jgi:hypothetical protein
VGTRGAAFAAAAFLALALGVVARWLDSVAACVEAAAVVTGATLVPWLRRGGEALGHVGRGAGALLDAAERACLQPRPAEPAPAEMSAGRRSVVRRGCAAAVVATFLVLAAAWTAPRALPTFSPLSRPLRAGQAAEQARRVATLTAEAARGRDELAALRAAWLAQRADTAARVGGLEEALDAAVRRGQEDAWRRQQAEAALAQLHGAHAAAAARAARDRAALAHAQASRDREHEALRAANRRVAALEHDLAGRDRAAQAAEASARAQEARRVAVRDALHALAAARADADKHPATLPRATYAEAAKLLVVATEAERAVQAWVLRQAVRGPRDPPAFAPTDVAAAVKQTADLRACLTNKPVGGWEASSTRRRDRRCLALAAAEPAGMLAQFGANIEFLLEALLGVDKW